MQKSWYVARVLFISICAVFAILLAFLLIFYGTLPKSEPMPVDDRDSSGGQVGSTGTVIVDGANAWDGMSPAADNAKTGEGPPVAVVDETDAGVPVFEPEELPGALLAQAIAELETSTPPPGYSEEATALIQSGNLRNTISIADLPDGMRDRMSSDLEFRNRNGYDVEEDAYAASVTSVEQNIAGTDTGAADMAFGLSVIPQFIRDNYDYLGYSYPPGVEFQSEHDAVRRIFRNRLDNSTLVMEETLLDHGSAALTTEFVNENIGNCPAVLVKKVNASYGQYGQLNWNTGSISYAIYQFGKEDVLEGLSDIGKLLASANPEIHDC